VWASSGGSSERRNSGSAPGRNTSPIIQDIITAKEGAALADRLPARSRAVASAERRALSMRHPEDAQSGPKTWGSTAFGFYRRRKAAIVRAVRQLAGEYRLTNLVNNSNGAIGVPSPIRGRHS